MEARQPGLVSSARYTAVLAQLQTCIGPTVSFQTLIQAFPTADPEVIKEMLARSGRTGSASDFARVYVDTEQLMQERTTELEKEVADCRAGLADAQRKLEAAQLTEVLNDHSIMEGSALAVEVHSLSLRQEHRSSMSVELTCEEQVIRTKAAVTTKTARWEEAFTFPISHGSGDLVVTVVEMLPTGKNKIGQLAIPVKLLNDQLKHQSEFSLAGGEKGELQLSLQWIWSKVEYLRSLTVQWSDNLKSCLEELSHIQRQLAVLTSFARPMEQFPFPVLDGAVSAKVDQILSVAMGTETNLLAAVKLCTVCLIICSVLEVIARPDFPNLTISAGAFYFYAADREVRKIALKWFCMALFFSEIFDFVYFFLCLSVPFTQSLPYGERADVQLQRLSAALSFVNTLSKACAFLIFWKRAAACP